MTEQKRRKTAALERIERAVGAPLRRSGRDHLLPDGRRVLICYSKPQHEGRGFYVGLPNRLQSDDALVMLLGERDLVFPRAVALLRHSEGYSRSSDGRPIPDFQERNGHLTLRVARLDLSLPVDDRLDAYDDLVDAGGSTSASKESPSFGRPYRRDNEDTAAAPRDPFTIDPDLVDRGTRGHARTRNALAAYLTSHGIDPLDPAPGDPLFDLAWSIDENAFVAEVKSITDLNEERQLRLGLGQVLGYRHLMSDRLGYVVAVLAIERAPSDSGWIALCRHLAVRLVWAPEFRGLDP